jgi:putative transposase
MIYYRIADSRRWTLHDASTRIVRGNQIIAVESLNVRGQMANGKIARAVGDASYGELLRQIKYKAGWYGRTHLEISQWFPRGSHVRG